LFILHSSDIDCHLASQAGSSFKVYAARF